MKCRWGKIENIIVPYPAYYALGFLKGHQYTYQCSTYQKSLQRIKNGRGTKNS